MEDEKLVKIFNLTLKKRETILFFLIIVINGLIWIDLDIELDTCTRGMWKEVECVVYFFFSLNLIIFGSIIQFFFVLFSLLLCLHGCAYRYYNPCSWYGYYDNITFLFLRPSELSQYWPYITDKESRHNHELFL